MNFRDRPLNALIVITCVAMFVLLFGFMHGRCHYASVKPYMRFDSELRIAFVSFALETNSETRLKTARLIENTTTKRIRSQGAKVPIREIHTLLGEPEWEDESGCFFYCKVEPSKDFPRLQFIGLNPLYVDMCLIQEDYCHDE